MFEQYHADAGSRQQIISGTDAFLQIPQLLEQANVRRPLLLCEDGFDNAFLDDYMRYLPIEPVRLPCPAGLPDMERAEQGAALYRSEGCDGLLSVGGDDIVEVAKAVSLLLSGGKPGAAGERTAAPYHLAIPAEAGGGAASTGFCTLRQGDRLVHLRDWALLPDAVLLERCVLQPLQKHRRGAALMAGLVRCTEALWSSNATERSDGCARQGMALLLDNLLEYLLGDDGATEKVLQGATLAGQAANLTGPGAAGQLGDRLALHVGLDRGYGAALCLPWLCQYFLKHRGQWPTDRIDRLDAAFETIRQAYQGRSQQEAQGQFRFLLDLLDLPAPEGTQADVEAICADGKWLYGGPLPLPPEQVSNLLRDLLCPQQSEGLANNAPADRKLRRGINADIQELQQLELEILLLVDEYCRKHGLRYYLGEGTLLGAIRHNGFIPWDDDIDITMEREHYDRFVRQVQAEPIPGINLSCFETNPNHWVLGAKLQMTRQTRFHQEKVAKLAPYSGPYIDLFPLERVPRLSSAAQHKQGARMGYLRRMLFIKTGYSRAGRSLRRYAMRAIAPFIRTKDIHRMIDRTLRTFEGEPGKYLVNLCSYYPVERETFPASYYGEPRFVPFEGHLMPIPREAETMLRTIYGVDYRKLPSPQVRGSRMHTFLLLEDDD